MKEYFIRLSLLIKRQLTNKLYICFLIAMPICVLICCFADKTDSNNHVPVGYFIEDKTEKTFYDTLKESLDEISGNIDFIEYSNRNEMLYDTSSSILECSYIFTNELFEGLVKDDYKRTILVFSSPSTVLSPMVNEMVFASVFRAFGDSTLYVYIDNNPDIFDNTDNKAIKNALLNEYIDEIAHGHSFTLDFKIYDDAVSDTKANVANTKTSGYNFPLHGIIAIFMFLCLLLACSDYCNEHERGTFNMLSAKNQALLSTCILQSWLIPAVLSSVVSLFIGNIFNSNNIKGNSSISLVFYEAFTILFYYLLLILFGFVVNIIVKKSIFIISLIPILIIGSLIFCPIIINLSAILPIARVVEKLFLPYYYLIFF